MINMAVPRADRHGLVGAAAMSGLTVLAVVAWAALLVVRQSREHHLGLVLDDTAPVLVALVLAVAGLLIVAHRAGGRRLGLLLLATACGMVLARAGYGALTVFPVGHTALTAVLVTWVVSGVLESLLIGLLPLWFPDGRLPGRWGWPYVLVLTLWAIVVSYLPLTGDTRLFGLPNPLAEGPLGGPGHAFYLAYAPAVNLSALAVLAAGLLVVARRWRRVGPLRRRQAAVFIPPLLLWVAGGKAAYYLEVSGWSRLALLGLPALLLGAALAHVFTRDRLWSIDRLARGLITGGILMVVVVVAGGVLLAVVFALAPGSGTGTVLLMTASGVLAGLAARPALAWSARVTDRLYYGDRAEPYKLVRTLAADLGRATAPQQAPELLCATVAEGLRLPGARLTVRTRDGERTVQAHGRAQGPEESLDLVYDREVIGHLVVGVRAGERELDGADRDVLRLLADQAAPAVAANRLYEELRVSRQLIVTAREEERRRLRREIHDGLGATLSALRLRLDTATAQLAAGQPAAATLETAAADVSSLIVDVRRITTDLMPAALADVGLVQAVRRLADLPPGAGPRISLEIAPDPFPGLPAALEVAAYRILSEALANALRHARAATCAVRLTATGDEVTAEVADSGIGFATDRRHHGVGLSSMAERAAELGGTFCVSSGPDGTTVRVRLPLEPHSSPPELCGQYGGQVGPQCGGSGGCGGVGGQNGGHVHDGCGGCGQ